MKSKKTTYFLIAALILVWAVIANKAFFKKDTSDKLDFVFSKQELTPKEKSAMDTFSLKLNYQDPFDLSIVTKKKSYANPQVSTVVKSKTKVPPVKPKPVIKQKVMANSIKYYGVIKNQNQANLVGVLYKDNMELLVFEGFKEEGIEVLRLTEKEIELVYQEQVFILKFEEDQ